MSDFSDHQKLVDDYLKKYDHQIYNAEFMPPFDMRGYARYIKEHHLSAQDITPEIMKKFIK